MVESERSNYLEAQMTAVTAQVMKIKKLLRVSHSKERMSLAELKTLNARRRNLLGQLRTLCLQMPGFQALIPKDVVDGFSIFCRWLAVLLSDLASTRRWDIGCALN